MRNTNQKTAVLQAVLNSCDHPDVDTIYYRAKQTLNNIGIATVYRVLTSLSKQGIILKIECETGDRYDKTITPHAHFKCNSCGAVSDVMNVDVQNCLSVAEKERKYQIDGVNLLFNGVCENCLTRN